MDLNEQTYNSPEVVLGLARRSELQPAEAVVLALLGPQLAAFDVLDIGVGGGRTSVHLLPRARRYRGIDFSPAMIAACRARFPEQAKLFEVGDARDLRGHRAGAYDFTLFSYNGLDYVSHADRLRALTEIRRVTRPGGWFCMSSHNLRFLDVRIPPRPFSLEALARAISLRALNPWRDWSRLGDHAIVRDMRRTVTYHVKPTEQLRQLEHAGFVECRIYDSTGVTLDVASAERCRDAWLHYLCRRARVEA